MKILHIEGGSHLYGGALQVFYLIQDLSKKSVQNVLICSVSSDLVVKAKPFSKVYDLQMKSDLDIGLLIKFVKIIKFEKPDIIHLHSRRIAEVLGGISAKVCGVPCVLSRRVDNKEKKLLIYFKYSMYKRIIAISEGIKTVLTDQGIEEKKIICVKSAVEINLYSKPIDKRIFRKQLHLEPNVFLIGMIAQFIHRKGHDQLVYAVKNLKSEFKNIRVLLYGQGPLFSKIKKLVFKLNMQDNFHFMGFIKDLENHIGGLDLIVHPAEKEGLGVSLLQATTAKVPIVASNVGGIPEVVENNTNGFLVPPRNHKLLQQAIKKMILDPNLRINFGLKGNKLARKKFSINTMSEGNLNVYKEILRQV